MSGSALLTGVPVPMSSGGSTATESGPSAAAAPICSGLFAQTIVSRSVRSAASMDPSMSASFRRFSRVVDQRAGRARVSGSFGERATSMAPVLDRADVLGPRLDARLGDGGEVEPPAVRWRRGRRFLRSRPARPRRRPPDRRGYAFRLTVRTYRNTIRGRIYVAYSVNDRSDAPGFRAVSGW